MSNLNSSPLNNQAGFTLVELLVVIALVAVIFVTFASFFNNYLVLYDHYQTDGTSFTQLSQESQRVSQVLRGLSDIISESNNNLEVYAYFSPADTYVSQVDYYLNSTNTALLATVTPMTANPPIGTPIPSKAVTYTIVSNYYKASGVNLFNYYDATDSLLTLPISDEHSIQEIQVNLTEPASHNANGQTFSVTVSLRNRKTDL